MDETVKEAFDRVYEYAKGKKELLLLVTGSEYVRDHPAVILAVLDNFLPFVWQGRLQLIEGGNGGVDRSVRFWIHTQDVYHLSVLAKGQRQSTLDDRYRLREKSPLIRSQMMINKRPDFVVAFPLRGASKNVPDETSIVIRMAKDAGILTLVFEYNPETSRISYFEYFNGNGN